MKTSCLGRTTSTIALAIGIAWSPAWAQGMDPSMQMNMPMPAEPAPPPKPSRKPKHAPSDTHAHAARSVSAVATDSAGKTSNTAVPSPSTSASSSTPAGGHDMAGMSMDTMPGMQMPPAKETAVLQTPVPTLTDADRVAAFPPVSPHPMHDHDFHAFTLFDRFETHGSAFEWEGSTWIGTDLDRLWIRSEGQRANGRVEDADLEVLYGRSVATWWDVVAGIRHDITPGAGQNFAAVGIIGVAPGKFEVKATAYAGSGGQTTLRLEAEREFLLTQRLVLQPLVEVNLFGRDDARRGIGSGLATLEAGLRLRYEITRRFAPYIGMVREEAFGRTADFRRGDGDDVHDTRLVAGLRFWF